MFDQILASNLIKIITHSHFYQGESQDLT